MSVNFKKFKHASEFMQLLITKNQNWSLNKAFGQLNIKLYIGNVNLNTIVSIITYLGLMTFVMQN